MNGTLPKNKGLEELIENGKKYTNRVLFVSDMHRTPIYGFCRWSRYIAGDPNHTPEAAEVRGHRLGYVMKDVMDAIMTDITSYNALQPVDAVLIPGDISSDNYGYDKWLYGENYIRTFKEEVIDQLPMPMYAVPGNHDTYPNDMWKDVLGYDRQYSFKIGNAAFMMMDVFTAPADESGAGSWKGYDVEWLKEEIKKYPEGPIFLCSHHFGGSNEIPGNNEALKELVETNDRIVLGFRGHSHHNNKYVYSELGGLTVMDVGSYTSNYWYKVNDVWSNIQNNFVPAEAWGFGVLEWNDTEANYYYVKTARSYKDYYEEFPDGNFQLRETPVEVYYDGDIENKYTVTYAK